MTTDPLLPGFTRRRVQAGEVALHAAVGGDGPPVVLLHGYHQAFADPRTIHATCEDYRAGASVDVANDGADRDQGRRIQAPLLLLWGQPPGMEPPFDPLAVWRRWAADVDGTPLPCGHFLAEERPDEVVDALRGFLA